MTTTEEFFEAERRKREAYWEAEAPEMARFLTMIRTLNGIKHESTKVLPLGHERAFRRNPCKYIEACRDKEVLRAIYSEVNRAVCRAREIEVEAAARKRARQARSDA